MQKFIFFVALVASSLVLVSSTVIIKAPVCGRNEKYVESCSKTACTCIDGHTRDNKGVCTPIQKCPPVCGKNEKYAEHCSNVIACICIDGYVRDDQGVCKPQCGENQEYSSCTNGKCVPRNCTQLGAPVHCVDIVPEKCIPGCVCKSGYLFNPNGICVPEERCCDYRKHRVYSKCINGDCFGARKCEEKGCPEKCYKTEPKDCIKGCICEKRYLEHKGECIPEDKCPPKCTKENEVLDECPTCPERTCGGDDRCVKCEKLEVGNSKCPPPACRCAVGFYRTPNGYCVKREKCQPQCGENQEYSDCINGKCSGPRNCTELGAPVRCVDIIPDKCIPGCVCKAGYLFNPNGKCVPKERCCDYRKHEVYSKCINGDCFGARNCDEKGCPEKCYKIKSKDCIEGCICKKRYLRHKGECIPEDKCPPKCTKENEVLDECPTCERKCGVDYRLVKCGKLEVGNPKCPPPACTCTEGFYRTPNGDCVKREECPAVC